MSDNVQTKTGDRVTQILRAEYVLDGALLSRELKGGESDARDAGAVQPAARLTTNGVSAILPGGGELGLIGTPKWRADGGAEQRDLRAVAASVARAYQDIGMRLLQHLHGHFALVLVDKAQQALHIATDRMGSFPLYYRVLSDCGTYKLSCGVRIEDVLMPGDDASEASVTSIRSQAIYNYMYFHMVPSEGTIYEGCSKLPIASHINLAEPSRKPEKYSIAYNAPEMRGAVARFAGDPHARLRELLEVAVSESMGTGSEPVGAFLSGGLDSSSVVGMMARCAGSRRSEAFAIGFDADGYDEMPYARLTAEHFGVKLNEYYLTPEDIVDALPKLAACTDEPFGNSSIIPTYFCAKVAGEAGFKVMLGGDGGDEIFAGNTRYKQQLVFERYRKLPTLFRKGLLEPLVHITPRGLPLASKAKSFVRQACTDLPARLHTYNFMHREASEAVFTADFLRDVQIQQPRDEQAAVFQAVSHSPLSQMLYLDWQYTLADNDLRKVRQACEFAGIDVRFPLLSDELVAFSTTLDDDTKLSAGELRGFYKAALRGWLPEQTISKTKHGFGLPFGVWMSTHKPLRDIAHAAINDLGKRGIFREDFLHKAIESHGTVHAVYYGELVWILTVLELWLQSHA